MCDMHMLYKTGTVCLRMADPYFMFDRIGVRTIRTHMRSLLLADFALSLKQVLSLCPISTLPTFISGGDM